MVDSFKTFLYVLLFVLGFFIWQTWQQEHASKGISAETVELGSNDAPTFTEAPSDTIQLKDSPQVSPPTVMHQTGSAEHALIDVTTDTMALKLDPIGGNIVELKLLQYPVSLEEKDTPFTLLDNQPGQIYVAQSGLQSLMGPDTNAGQAEFKSAQSAYVMGDNKDSLQVTLNWQSEHGITVSKIFEFQRDNYLVDVKYVVQNNSNKDWQGRFYGQLKRQEPDSSSGLFGLTTYTGAAISSPDKRFDKKTFAQISEKGVGHEYTWVTQTPESWVAMVEHYFVSAWIPAQSSDKYDLYSLASRDDSYRIGMKGTWVTVPPGQSQEIAAKLYMGPEHANVLKDIAQGLNLTVDYGILWPISQLLYWIMNVIHSVVANWGVSIILVTVLIKACFFQLSAKGYRSMANMRRLQPKLTALKEKHGEDRQKMSQAMMDLYRKEKINPLGGCFPLLIQIPIFISLYWVLIESVELRQAPFMLWIQDLSVKDPYYVLPLLMCASMFVQQRLSPPPPDPMQAKMMMFMPVFFTALFLNFPAGLVLYWVVNNTLSIAQQWWITRSVENGAKKA